MSGLWSFLMGKKTYIVAGLTIAGALGNLWSGTIDLPTFEGVVAAALGLGAVRHGISTGK